MVSLTGELKDLIDIFGILSEATRILILVFYVYLNMQLLMIFFIFFSVDVFRLRKLTNFEKFTLTVFKAILLDEFLEQWSGDIVINHGVPGHLELIEIGWVRNDVGLHTLVVDEVDLYLVV